MLEDCTFAGFGGQGILMLGRLEAQAAMEEGLNATWLPSYGPEMRGGTCNCIVAFGDDEIGSPVAETYDAIVVMNQPSLEKFEPKVKPGGTLVINSSIIPVKATRTDIDVHYCPCDDLAEQETGGSKCANVAALGGLHAVRPRLQTESLEAALKTVFSPKGEEVVDMNLRALHAGIQAMTQSVPS